MSALPVSLNVLAICMQALVQFPDPVSASNAKQALEGHAIYDGGYNRVRDATALVITPHL